MEKIIQFGEGLVTFDDYFNNCKEYAGELIQLPKDHSQIFLNGITELPGRLESLGDLSANIPTLFRVESFTHEILSTEEIKRILITNICLISYYFRKHIVLKKNNY